MLVQQIVSNKPSGDIITISADNSIAQAAELMSEKRIGALIVSETGKDVQGVLSERDIVRELGRCGSECMAMSVRNLMTSEVVTCSGSDTTEEILQKMTDGRFRHMPVMDGDTLVAVVSIGDVVNARLMEISQEKDSLVDMIKGF
jgi:CBS domain-containing protein